MEYPPIHIFVRSLFFFFIYLWNEHIACDFLLYCQIYQKKNLLFPDSLFIQSQRIWTLHEDNDNKTKSMFNGRDIVMHTHIKNGTKQRNQTEQISGRSLLEYYYTIYKCACVIECVPFFFFFNLKRIVFRQIDSKWDE